MALICTEPHVHIEVCVVWTVCFRTICVGTGLVMR